MVLQKKLQYFRHYLLIIGFNMSFYLSSTLKNLLVKLYKDWDLLQFNIIEGIDEMKMD